MNSFEYTSPFPWNREQSVLFVKGVSTLEKDSMAKLGVILGSPMAKFIIDLNTTQLLTFSGFFKQSQVRGYSLVVEHLAAEPSKYASKANMAPCSLLTITACRQRTQTLESISVKVLPLTCDMTCGKLFPFPLSLCFPMQKTDNPVYLPYRILR